MSARCSQLALLLVCQNTSRLLDALILVMRSLAVPNHSRRIQASRVRLVTTSQTPRSTLLRHDAPDSQRSQGGRRTSTM